MIMENVGRYLKAVAAAATAASATLTTAMVDGNVQTAEWVTIALSALGALGVVYVVPNTKPVVVEDDYEGKHEAE